MQNTNWGLHVRGMHHTSLLGVSNHVIFVLFKCSKRKKKDILVEKTYSSEHIHNFNFSAFQLFSYKNKKKPKTFNAGFLQEFHLKMVEMVLES